MVEGLFTLSKAPPPRFARSPSPGNPGEDLSNPRLPLERKPNQRHSVASRKKEDRVIEGFQLDADWPRMSLKEVDSLLTAPGSRMETDEAVIRGRPTRIW